MQSDEMNAPRDLADLFERVWPLGDGDPQWTKASDRTRALIMAARAEIHALPDMSSRNWSVEHFTVGETDAALFRIRQAMHGSPRHVRPGSYVRLVQRESNRARVLMSTTDDELSDHAEFIENAVGRVLITGLGLGFVARAVAAKTCVDQVVVVEKSADVFDLIRPTLPADVHVVCGDAFEESTRDLVRVLLEGEFFDHVWHDVWPTMGAHNFEDFGRLLELYDPIAKRQRFWGVKESRDAYAGYGPHEDEEDDE